MNLKKYLRQQAEEDAEKLLTENDRLFCLQLAEQAQKSGTPKKVKKRKRKKISLNAFRYL